MDTVRVPTMNSALGMLVSSGLVIDTVIDVGVLTGTGYLQRFFPNAFHHLFEPIDSHVRTIEENYRSMRYELNIMALSSEAGHAFQVGWCNDASGATTHSQISDTHFPIGSNYSGGTVTVCKKVTKTTLDAHFLERGLPLAPYLVKIDVDGHEIPIINGGTGILSGAEIIIVEATLETLLERGASIQALGFRLIDMVDLCYYHHTLSQIDLVFACPKLLRRLPDLRPWETKRFSSEAWLEFSRRLTI